MASCSGFCLLLDNKADDSEFFISNHTLAEFYRNITSGRKLNISQFTIFIFEILSLETRIGKIWRVDYLMFS